METPVLKVGALAARTGLSVRTLHHYDEIGLLRPSRRTAAGHRLYAMREVERLHMIASLRQLGLSLEEIRVSLDGSTYSLERVLELQVDRLRGEIQRQSRLVERLEGLRGRVAQGEALWRQPASNGRRCADCHAVERLHTSPVPNAPSFEAVANAPGGTRESLSQWLRTSHDYPREMYFEIPEERIDDLVAYMLTLRSEDYEPAIGLAPAPPAHGSLPRAAAAAR